MGAGCRLAARRPGGFAGGQTLALFLTPLAYSLFDDLAVRFGPTACSLASCLVAFRPRQFLGRGSREEADDGASPAPPVGNEAAQSMLELVSVLGRRDYVKQGRLARDLS